MNFPAVSLRPASSSMCDMWNHTLTTTTTCDNDAMKDLQYGAKTMGSPNNVRSRPPNSIIGWEPDPDTVSKSEILSPENQT